MRLRLMEITRARFQRLVGSAKHVELGESPERYMPLAKVVLGVLEVQVEHHLTVGIHRR